MLKALPEWAEPSKAHQSSKNARSTQASLTQQLNVADEEAFFSNLHAGSPVVCS
jgi:hypothetical protein